MSPVVEIVAGAEPTAPAMEHPEIPRRVLLDLAGLLAAARLAGDVPLPIRLDASTGRLAERLSGGAAEDAARQVAQAQARAADDGPEGAVAHLAALGVVGEDGLDPALAHALRVIAGGVGFLQVDLSDVRDGVAVGLRSWIGIHGRFVSQLSTSGGDDWELAWFDGALWHSQMLRTVTLDGLAETPEVSSAAVPVGLPAWASVPTELFLGVRKAMADQQGDLVPAMVQAHTGQVLVAAPGETPVALADEEAVGLLAVLVGESRGRLRVRAARRDGEAAPGVLSWVLFDDGWHELAPGPGATTEFRRRDVADVSVLLEPFAARAMREGAS